MRPILYAATDVGGLLIDGLGDRIFYFFGKEQNHTRRKFLDQIKLHNATGFGVLAANRMSKNRIHFLSILWSKHFRLAGNHSLQLELIT
jgi:(E)-4-hydroxy-3-methylbut-2-enyl-diphosphate synthase